MEKLEGIVFLALCGGLPFVMLGLLIYLGISKLRSRQRERAAVAEGGWDDADADAAREALEDAGFSFGPRVQLYDVRGRDGLLALRYARRPPAAARAHASGTRRAVLVLERPAPGPSMVIQPQGGALAGGLTSLVGALGGPRPLEAEGWEWAAVYGPGEPPPGAWSAPIRELLGPQDRLHLGPRWVALSRDASEMDALLRDAPELAERLRATLADATEAAPA